MTVEQVVLAALGRASEFGTVKPSPRASMYRRIGIRQQQLFADSARWNPDWAGVCATGTLSSGAVDLADIIAPLHLLERITRIEVSNAGSSGYATGTKINIVSVGDEAAFDAPRATLRNKLLSQIGTDLTNVTSVKVYYTRVTEALDYGDAATAIELPPGHDELLVVDLVRWLVQKSPDIQNKADKVAMLADEEAGLVEGFRRHVVEYANMDRRFGAPAYPPVPMGDA